ncbi:MAG: SpoIVB peptidase S55 domain-containing protein [Candidatus Sumerlaeia bacterium]|nr:SpoIVB peptidase S55 domain-containing protein [Candidatus Sumerlaeia bacterium]
MRTRIPLGLLAAAAFAAGPAAAEPARRERPPLLSPAELAPGIKGYGLTVFNGTEPERFDVTIVGVAKNYRPGRDMILADLDHPLIREHGVVAGMSGSPVYIDGKLIGAVAYGWGFSIRPLAGIQPIEYMLDVMDLVTDEPAVDRALPMDLSQWPAAAEVLSPAARSPFAPGPSVSLPGEFLRSLGVEEATGRVTVTLQPLSPMLLLGTDSPEVLEIFNERFGQLGVRATAAGGMGSSHLTGSLDTTRMVPGGAMGAAMVEGDMTLGAIGTATWVEEDRLVAFGHPMSFIGKSDMPVSSAHIDAVIPSLGSPFKLGRLLEPLGALRQDRMPAIGITRTRRPEMRPVTVRIEAPEVGEARNFSYRIWPDRTVFHPMTDVVFAESLSNTVRESGPMSIDAEMTITLADGTVVRRRTYQSAFSFTGFFASSTLSRDLGLITANAVADMPVAAVDIVARVGSALQLRVVEEARLDAFEARPGQTLHGTVRLGAWRAEDETVRFELTVPKDARPGSYTVALLDAREREALEYAVRPELRRLDTPAQILDRLSVEFPENTLYAVLLDTAEGLAVSNQDMSGMPRSLESLTRGTIRQSNLFSSTGGRILSETLIERPAQVGGSRRFGVIVRPATDASGEGGGES